MYIYVVYLGRKRTVGQKTLLFTSNKRREVKQLAGKEEIKEDELWACGTRSLKIHQYTQYSIGDYTQEILLYLTGTLAILKGQSRKVGVKWATKGFRDRLCKP